MLAPPLDQAVFTSVRSRTMDGYQLAAASRGVTAEEAKELTIWGPAHDSLLDTRPGAQSVNFHRLETGRFSVSLTTALNAEYSGRGGCQVYTQSLVVAPETLRQFANDPFRLLEAAQAGGRLQPLAVMPDSLEAFSLLGGAGAVNGGLVTRLVREVGAAPLGRLIDAVLANSLLAIACRTSARRLFAGLLNLMPLECRPEFSFTTGLRHSARRPFRLLSLGDEASPRYGTAHARTHASIDLDDSDTPPQAPHAWADLVTRMLQGNRLSSLTELLRESRPSLKSGDLEQLASSLAPSTLAPTATVN